MSVWNCRFKAVSLELSISILIFLASDVDILGYNLNPSLSLFIYSIFTLKGSDMNKALPTLQLLRSSRRLLSIKDNIFKSIKEAEAHSVLDELNPSRNYPKYEGHIILLSTAFFILYFGVLREENDIDKKMREASEINPQSQK
ncbi:hypothetical protein GJ496_000782 [Pomphorhynchus laevis]|nr:hypothetical protein GJ496_000782 [Pomphorhynchus laevis]